MEPKICDVIAEITLKYSICDTGEVSNIYVCVRKPFTRDSDQRPVCPVSITGICDVVENEGEDLFDVLCLAVNFVGSVIGKLYPKRKIYWEDGSDFENIWINFKPMTLVVNKNADA